jgi:transcriptional regulator GlxA family with amidase domain
MTRNIAIFLFDEVEVLDFGGPFEVFCTAGRMAQRSHPLLPSPFEVFTVAQKEGLVQARGGLRIQAQTIFSNSPKIDVLLVPGGVVTAEMEKSEVIAWIKRTAPGATVVASVCTGAFLLAKAGLLDGLPVTTHWEDMADLGQQFPQVQVKEGVRWVDTGKVVTSAGISAGLDMSLYLVEKLEGRDLAVRTARQMDYAWQDRPWIAGAA